MKVLRGQEACSESNKGSLGPASRLLRVLPGFEHPCSEIHANLWKYMKCMKCMKFMKIQEIQWRFSEDKKPAWNRAKVSRGPTSRLWRVVPGFKHPCSEIHANLWNTRKSIKPMEIHEDPKIRSKSSEDKKPAWNRAKVSLGPANRFLKTTKIYENT